MILSDREIRLAVERRHISLTPLPAVGNLSSTSIDLTLDEELTLWQPPAEVAGALVVRPHDAAFDLGELLEAYGVKVILPAGGFVMEPWSFLLAWTLERVQLPPASRLAARVEGRSTLARLGLGIHVTAPTIHAGFGSTGDPNYLGAPIRLEIWNIGPFRIQLEKGMRVCQLILEEVHGTPEKGYTGTFATQGPSPPEAAAGPRRRRRKR